MEPISEPTLEPIMDPILNEMQNMQNNVIFLQNKNIILEKKLEFYKKQVEYYKSIEYVCTIPPLSIYTICFLHNTEKNIDYIDYIDIGLLIVKDQLRVPIIRIPYDILSEMINTKPNIIMSNIKTSYIIKTYIMTDRHANLTKIKDTWMWVEEKN